MAKRYSGWQGYIATNNILTLNQSKTFFVSTYYQYNSPSKVGYNTATSSSTLDVGFKYITLDKKLTIGVMFEDVFRKNFSIYQNFSSEILQNFKQYYDTRLFRFSLSYKFGNSKIVVNQRNIGNQEEKRRSK
ncbi:outer membrane beta-barrel protein [Myroides sp. TSA_177.3]|uniref:outer membrane beta-barrel protein n=1 Tax=Myroides sp. TSA_177.3 TaxID=3415650 RepID=UPI0040462FEE